MRAEVFEQFFRSVNDSRYDLAGHKALVASYGGRKEDVVGSADAEEVVDVHDQSVLRYALPHRQVACAAPIGVSEGRLCSGTVGVHDVAPFRVAGEIVRHYFAESAWENTFVDVFDSCVYIFLGCRHAT